MKNQDYRQRVNEVGQIFLNKDLFKKNVYIVKGRWLEIGMSNFCQKIVEWEVQNLIIYRNCHKDILIDLIPVTFSSLLTLNLMDNLIESVESIHLINFPCLENLHLGQNQIIRFDSFRKTSFKLLKRFQLMGNKITNLQCLLGNNIQIEDLVLEEYHSDPIQSNNLKWIIKLKHFSAFREIVVRGNKRIRFSEKHFGQQLEKNNPTLTFYH